MKTTGFLLLFILLLSTIAYAKEKTYGNFTNITFVNNYDADTITVNIDDVPPLFGHLISVRVYGIDSPEMHGKCEKEQELARIAKKYVHDLLANSYINLLNVRRDKYFRILADVETSKGSLAKLLLDNGYAIEYYGDTKTKDWCK